MNFELHKRDAIELLRSLPAGSIDLVITDPAYQSLEKHRAKGTTTRLKQSKASSNEWFQIFPNSRFPEFLAECHRALADDRHCYILCDQETMFLVKSIVDQQHLFTWKKFLVWEKTNADGSTAVGMGYTWRASHEVVCYLEKGKRKLNDLSLPDVIRAPRVRDSYPTAKPVELLEKLVLNSSSRGDLVVDPFFGSGSTGEAALRHGRFFIGGDISDAAHTFAEPRLRAVVAGMPPAQVFDAPLLPAPEGS